MDKRGPAGARLARRRADLAPRCKTALAGGGSHVYPGGWSCVPVAVARDGVAAESWGEAPVHPTDPLVAALPVQRRLEPDEQAELVACYCQGVPVDELAVPFRSVASIGRPSSGTSGVTGAPTEICGPTPPKRRRRQGREALHRGPVRGVGGRGTAGGTEHRAARAEGRRCRHSAEGAAETGRRRGPADRDPRRRRTKSRRGPSSREGLCRPGHHRQTIEEAVAANSSACGLREELGLVPGLFGGFARHERRRALEPGFSAVFPSGLPQLRATTRCASRVCSGGARVDRRRREPGDLLEEVSLDMVGHVVGL